MKIKFGFISNSSSTSFLIKSKRVKEYYWLANNIDIKNFLLGKMQEFLKILHKEDDINEIVIIQDLKHDDFKQEIKVYWNDYYSVPDDFEEYDLIIDSYHENSIPYIMQKFFENELYGRRYHWG